MNISFRLKPSGIISISWLKTTMADMIFKDQHVDVKKLQKKDKHRSGERVRALTWSHMIARKKYGTNFPVLKKIAFRIGFLKDWCRLRLCPRLTAARCSPHHATSSSWARVTSECCAASSSWRKKKVEVVLISMHLKLKNTLLYEFIQIKFWFHRCISYDNIFKTRPHLIIFR